MKKINYKNIARNVIDLEIAALKKLRSSINKSFDLAVDAIVKCQSKIILCGVGKSYLIASKISATFPQSVAPLFLYLQTNVRMEIWAVSPKKIC